MSDRFCVTDSSILRCRDRGFSIVLKYLKRKFVYLPKDNNVKAKIIDDFRIGSQFLNVLGAIDCIHIHIVAPSKHGQVYVNRKKSIRWCYREFVQVICNSCMY